MIRSVHPALLAVAAAPCLAGLLFAYAPSPSLPTTALLAQDGVSAASQAEVTEILDERLQAIQSFDAAAIWTEAS